MISPIIIGTMALDSIKTPFGEVNDALGGSATFSSIAASFFSKPGILSIVGKDFPKEHMDFLHSRNIDTTGVSTGDKTFRWKGFYEFDMNEAKTLNTELNVLADYKVEIPKTYEDAEYAFLGNIDPEQQIKVIDSLKKPKLIAMDTMNFWIDIKKDILLEAIKKSDILVINDGEARQLFETTNLVKAANKALKLVSKAVIIKKGEHGALLFTDSKHFNAPSYPLEDIKDPTGCGDCFGGGLIGYLAKTNNFDEANIRKAMIYGSTIASYNAEGFGTERLKEITLEDIEKRYKVFEDIREF
ncbi:sugar kinase [Candidatus Woesearchaeota archaeon]|nr:sugar kinase [Candidatus Woesearchaeota archaeon]